MSSQISRRDFIRLSSISALGLSVFPSIALKATAPSDTLRIAHIGLGGMGNQHMNWFAALPGVDIVALCDVDQDHLNSTLQSLKALKPDSKAKGYEDFRHVLDRQDIDA